MSRRAYLLCLIVAVLAASGLHGCDGLSFRSPPPPPALSERKQAAPADAPHTEPVTQTPTAAQQPPHPVPVIQPYTEWTLSQTAEDSLGRIGAAAVPELARLLQDRDPAVRQMAARILARIGPDAVEAVPNLIQLLQDRQPQVQRSAVRALGQIGPEGAAAVPALLRLLDASPTDSPDSVDPSRPPGS